MVAAGDAASLPVQAVHASTGTYSPTAGASSASACQTCPASSASPRGNSAAASCECLPGHAADTRRASANYVITVADSVFVVDATRNPSLELRRGGEYTFSQGDASNAGHPIAFQDTMGDVYTTGVSATGTPGDPGVQTVLSLAADAPDDLRYYCAIHDSVGSTMGSTICAAPPETACIACSAGKHKEQLGPEACLACVVGKFSGSVGAGACQECPAGTYSETEASVCVDCAVGKFSGSVGAGACLEQTAIVVVTQDTLEVLMKVELPYTKALFDADAQNKFLSAVANSVQTAVCNVYIKSVVEKTSSRRVFLKLLAVAVQVEVAIRVQDTAAQAAMIANDGLTETKLNTELSKQAFLVSACVGKTRCLLQLCAVRARGR